MHDPHSTDAPRHADAPHAFQIPVRVVGQDRPAAARALRWAQRNVQRAEARARDLGDLTIACDLAAARRDLDELATLLETP